jgi:stress-induced morphogen
VSFSGTDIKEILSSHFSSAEIAVSSLSDSGRNFVIEIISGEFSGKTRIQQHRMVYDVLKDKFGIDSGLHALQIVTRCP